jgi:hypothetical protein
LVSSTLELITGGGGIAKESAGIIESKAKNVGFEDYSSLSSI